MTTTETIKPGDVYDGFTYQEAASMIKDGRRGVGPEVVIKAGPLSVDGWDDAELFRLVILLLTGAGPKRERAEGLIYYAYLFGLDEAVKLFKPGEKNKRVFSDYSGRVVVLVDSFGEAGQGVPDGNTLLRDTLLEGPGAAAAAWREAGEKIRGWWIRDIHLVEAGNPPIWGAVCMTLSGAHAVIIDNRAAWAGSLPKDKARGRGG